MLKNDSNADEMLDHFCIAGIRRRIPETDLLWLLPLGAPRLRVVPVVHVRRVRRRMQRPGSIHVPADACIRSLLQHEVVCSFLFVLSFTECIL